MSSWARWLAGGILAGLLSCAATAAEKPAKMGLGREALPEEIAAWDTDVRPDGKGLPVGRGTVKQGDEIFQERCAACHGEFGQGAGRWPALAGGQGTLRADRPDKTIGSFWPDDETYALVAFLLSLNDVVKDDNFELSDKNFTSIKLPNALAFYEDDRDTAEKKFWNGNPCMKDCRAAPKVISKATSLNVTPDGKSGPKVD